MAVVIISSAVSSTGLYVSHSETLEVKSGGLVRDTTVRGLEIISGGGSALRDVIDAGIGDQSEQEIDGGTAISTVIHSAGYEVAISGGAAEETTIDGGGHVLIGQSGSGVSDWIESNGYMSLNGGYASQVTVEAGGTFLVLTGEAVSTVVETAALSVSAGGVVIHTIAEGTTTERTDFNVSNAGSAVSSFIRNGGTIDVEFGGYSTRTIVSSGGFEVQGGVGEGSYIYNGGTEYFGGPGEAIDTVVSSGGAIDWYNWSAQIVDVALRPGAEIFVSVTSASALISGGTLEIIENGSDKVLGTASLKDAGSGIAVEAIPISAGKTEILVTSASSPGAIATHLAQAIAAHGDSFALPASATSQGADSQLRMQLLLHGR